MDIRTYRAATMHEALAMVRRELGPDAAVLHTREVPADRWWQRLRGLRHIEVTASLAVNVPSRFASRAEGPAAMAVEPPPTALAAPAAPALAEEVKGQLHDLQAALEELCRQARRSGQRDLPETLFRLFTDLIEADLPEDVARELVERVRREAPNEELADPVLLKARVGRMIEAEIAVSGPIAVTPGRCRLVALVGPTGVGKTTTIAKLAAQYRLKRKHNVGLITVDTYRIAAVEQLRTYAEIIDLPMQVVSTPREMRDAVRRMRGLDLILLDTAGRSPQDDIKIRELRAFLAEASADEVHLVLSAVASARTLEQTARHFAAVGTTRLILTKLDEATSLGNLLPLVRSCKLPLSYLTNGQNVPDDIETAEPGRVARLVMAVESAAD
ncbi:MAG: flagellar biosynthesis protein FlhF [Thermoguttaceae bacterium]